MAGYPYCSRTWQIVTQMGHVSPGGRPNSHHSGPQCTALLSWCIYNTEQGWKDVLHPQVPSGCHFFLSVQMGLSIHLHQTQKIISIKSSHLLLVSCHLFSFLFFFLLFFFFVTMFALLNGNFCRLKTLQHILGLWTCSFLSS